VRQSHGNTWLLVLTPHSTVLHRQSYKQAIPFVSKLSLSKYFIWNLCSIFFYFVTGIFPEAFTFQSVLLRYFALVCKKCCFGVTQFVTLSALNGSVYL